MGLWLLVVMLVGADAVDSSAPFLKNLEGFSPQPAGVQQPYPGWKICRVLRRSVLAYYGGGRVESSTALTYPAPTRETRQAVSRAAKRAGLVVRRDWQVDEGRAEYFKNDRVHYGFRALELSRDPETRIYVGVTDQVKNKTGVSAVCVLEFVVPR